jgi:arylsulfatase A-like enzyme
VTTLPERLRARGYLTAAIVHNPLLPPERNLNQGFTQYLDLHEPAFGDSTGARLLQTSWPSRFPSAAWPSPAEQTDLALSWLRSNRANSFFLWVHFFDPHAPYTPTREDVVGQPPAGLGFRFDGQNRNTPLYLVPAADQRRWIRELYDAEARRVDANIGRLLQALRDQQLYDGSLIVLTSDHGEEFWEHGAQGHGQSLYGELLDVPLIIKVPGASVSRRVTTPVSTVSVTPTVLDLAGVGYAADDLSARSLSPMLNPDAPAPAAVPILSNYILTSGVFVDRRDAVTFGGMKYLTGPLERHHELFDISSDPGEQHPLDASSPDRLADLQRRLAEQLAAATALRKRLQIEEGSVDIDADTARRLRTLGYLK